VAAAGRAQAPAPTARPADARANEADANADVSITARVTADSLRFEKVPNPRVEFTGRPERDTVWEAERENIPRPRAPPREPRARAAPARRSSRRGAESAAALPLKTSKHHPKPFRSRKQFLSNFSEGTMKKLFTAGAVIVLALCAPAPAQTTTTNQSGQTVRRVLDTTGAVIELTLDAAGRVVNSRVVSQATGQP
jgi:hypothetical protein